MIDKSAKIFISGHLGMLGLATLTYFKSQGYTNIITASRQQLDLRNQLHVNEFFADNKPDYVIHLAAKVGGIQANIAEPASFLYDNLTIQTHVIHASYLYKVKKFVFLGSSCIYPYNCVQPMKEEYLLSGPLEPTNEAYAMAKIAGIMLLKSYHQQYGFKSITLIPPNLYGPHDSFDLESAHVLSSLVKRLSDAKDALSGSVTLWGTGIARREFLHVDDLARAIVYMFENYEKIDPVNIGTGADISIKELAELIAGKVGYAGSLRWDAAKPNGMLRKCMDITKMKSAGFVPAIDLHTGIDQVIDDYRTKHTAL